MRAKQPTVILTTKEETLAWLAAHDEAYPDKYQVKSLWLFAELNRFEADGYVYNREAQERICRENGLEFEASCRRRAGLTTRTEGGLLSALVYNAQAYRREMNLEQAGWKRFAEIGAQFIGKKVAAICNGSLGGELVVKVVDFAGVPRLAPLRSRKKAYAIYEDWWIKPVTA